MNIKLSNKHLTRILSTLREQMSIFSARHQKKKRQHPNIPSNSSPPQREAKLHGLDQDLRSQKFTQTKPLFCSRVTKISRSTTITIPAKSLSDELKKAALVAFPHPDLQLLHTLLLHGTAGRVPCPTMFVEWDRGTVPLSLPRFLIFLLREAVASRMAPTGQKELHQKRRVKIDMSRTIPRIIHWAVVPSPPKKAEKGS